jgi:hypothetical protein
MEHPDHSFTLRDLENCRADTDTIINVERFQFSDGIVNVENLKPNSFGAGLSNAFDISSYITPKVYLVTPSLGSVYKRGEFSQIGWKTTGKVSGLKVAFYLDTEANCNSGNCAKNIKIFDTSAEQGYYNLQIPLSVGEVGGANATLQPGNYYFRISLYDPTKGGISVAEAKNYIRVEDDYSSNYNTSTGDSIILNSRIGKNVAVTISNCNSGKLDWGDGSIINFSNRQGACNFSHDFPLTGEYRISYLGDDSRVKYTVILTIDYLLNQTIRN